jgi:hypothetical protein
MSAAVEHTFLHQCQLDPEIWEGVKAVSKIKLKVLLWSIKHSLLQWLTETSDLHAMVFGLWGLSLAHLGITQ